MGFYYKEHEILPPLPGLVLALYLFYPLAIQYSSHCSFRFSPIHIVGFHRYIVKNLSSGSLDQMVEEEVDEFDPPSEV